MPDTSGDNGGDTGDNGGDTGDNGGDTGDNGGDTGPAPVLGTAEDLIGVWYVTNLGVGPTIGDTSWWNFDSDAIALQRPTYGDDAYIFDFDTVSKDQIR